METVFFYFITFCLGASLGAWFINSQLTKKLQAKNEELTKLQIEMASLQSQNRNFEMLNKQINSQFETLANKIFDDKSQKFSDQNVKNLMTLLDPFKERLKDFEKKVEETYSTERAERGTLRGELSKLVELNVRMSNEAQNLTKALKGDNKTMGNWGELILESILEKSGLRVDEEYTLQGSDMSLKNDSGKDIRPDVIINLPEGKHLIVDSKVSLKDYDSYIQSDDDTQRELFAKNHVESLKRHIDGLSEKKYHSAEKLLTPDFVILFMPIEPAFALAFKYRPDLLQYAWDRNIALVSPTTLLTTLRTVSTIWKQERQERNALEIAKRGGALYDKFVLFVDDLEKLGGQIQGVQKAHSLVMNKLTDGTGNLLRQVELLRELGAKAEKKISPHLLKHDVLKEPEQT